MLAFGRFTWAGSPFIQRGVRGEVFEARPSYRGWGMGVGVPAWVAEEATHARQNKWCFVRAS